MKIKLKNIETYHFKHPYKNFKFPNANHVINGTIFFKIYTNNDVVGFGEPSSYLGDYKLISKLVLKKIFPVIKNKNIYEINTLNIKKKFEKNNNKFIINCLIAGIDQCIWDIKSKISNKNLSNYITKKNKINRKIGLYASGGMIYDDQKNDIIFNEALKFESLGFKGYKFRPPIPRKKVSHFERIKKPPTVEIKKLVLLSEKIRKNVDGKFKLMLDLGCRINNFKDFYYLSDCLNELNFSFIEEPFKRSIENYQKIHKNSKLKISFGESLTGKQDFINWSKYIDILQPDTNMITITELLNLRKIFKKLNKIIIFHNWANPISMLSNFHLSSIFNCNLIEYNITDNPAINYFLKERFRIKNGYISINNKKGIGANINNKFVNKYSKKI